MDQSAMVKEYSRSSADQEEPLSHELRPPKVLNMTMDYLLCNVMDRFALVQELKTPKREERRIASPEEIRNITSIICKGISEEINKKQILQEHFSKFGKVRRITCGPQKNYAVIYFYDHESAKAAREKGSLIKSGYPPLEIFWSAVQKRRNSSPRDSSSVSEELKAMEGSLQEPKLLERPKIKTHTQVKQQRAQKAVKRSSHTVREQEAGSVSSEALYNVSALMSSPAVSSQDKYKILDARDKMIRL
ncbi:germinal-center associated nuclear protein-like, partial [Limulus polyphemus]|uniref:Germinal-center associated nuclear protein-like n=1 Tax=Limulus polyphemus TaxID=6850 RepID=A0ABM1RYC5_LIMPO